MDKVINENPKVSVLMPAFNAEKYIGEAIESILNQTFKNFEFIIINDGSIDNTENIILSYKDNRIVFVNDKENKGYIIRLNEGLNFAKGEFIARMDADDVSFPDRLEKQIIVMERYPDIGLLGTGCKTYDSSIYWQPEVEDLKLRLKMLKTNQFIHSSVMIRTSVLKSNLLYYDFNYHPAEDYELWFRISLYCKLKNLNEVLIKYRIHDKQTSVIFNNKQKENTNKTRINQIEYYFNITLSSEERNDIIALLSGNLENENSITQQKRITKKLVRIGNDNKEQNDLIPSLTIELKSILKSNIKNFYFHKFIIIPQKYGIFLLAKFILNKHFPFSYFRIKENILFIIKCICSFRKTGK